MASRLRWAARMKILVSSLFAAALVAAVHPSADACTLTKAPTVQQYESSPLVMRGLLYKPSNTNNLPVFVYIHGSGTSKPESMTCEMVNYYLGQGYAVFLPAMRGIHVTWTDSTGTSRQFTNGGTSFDDYNPSNSYLDTVTLESTYGIMFPSSDDYSALHAVEYLADEYDDVQQALGYVEGMVATDGSCKKLVNPNRVILAGHSVGGVMVTDAAQYPQTYQPTVTIDMSGGVLSWANSSVWRQTLITGASNHTMPLYLYNVTNESPTGTDQSTIAPFEAASQYDGRMEMSVFSEVPNEPSSCDAQCVHVDFITDGTQVHRWAPQVLDFAQHYGA